MKIQLSDLTTERKWRAATGFDQQRFEKLLELFKKSYLKIYGKPVKERQVQTEINYCLNSEEELLFFTLFSLKSGLTYDLLGLVCGMEASNAKRNQKTGVEVLQRIFPELGYAPKRKFMNINEFLEYFADTEELIIDATEQRIQRPSDKKSQKQYYSGKKTHTIKAMIISDKSTKIRYISHCRIGKTHDYRFLKEEFPPKQNWFAKFKVRVDLGYVGIARDYVCKSIMIPHKKRKKHHLTDEQKRENRGFAAERVAVEHSIDGIKRYRFLSDRLRTHDLDLYDNILEVCGGLWNFYLSK